MTRKTTTEISNGRSYQVQETDEARICVCPDKGGELSWIVYKRIMEGEEPLFSRQ